MDGILIVDKPQGMTSHDVVNLVRRRFNLKKVGHAGTLDPMATGVLVMLLGKATKSSGRFLCEDKEYEASMDLGATSDTGDAWGDVKPSGCGLDFKDEDIRGAIGKFLGEIDQVPPIYSAKKVNGKKLYQLARKGVSVKVEPRRVVIKKIDITDISLPRISFTVACSKGTYIRQLCVDIGEALGCGAYLSYLRRTRSGEFAITGAVTVERLKTMTLMDAAKVIQAYS